MKLLALSLLLQLPPTAPHVTRLASGDYLVPQAAFTAVDLEMKRLQAVEATHKGESWLTAILVSSAVGLVVGVVVSGLVVSAIVRPPMSGSN